MCAGFLRWTVILLGDLRICVVLKKTKEGEAMKPKIRLREARKSLRVSQYEVAAACGFSQALYWGFEKGYRRPSDEQKQAVCDFLGFLPSEIEWPSSPSKKGVV